MVEKFSIKELENFVEGQVEADEFSGVILVAKDEEPIFKKAYGLASKRFNIPNRVDTKFNIGSINKIFTKVAIVQLTEKGKLSFHDYIIKYLPDYPSHVASKVKVDHLLNHTSGMGHYWNEKFEAAKSKLRTVDDFIALFIDEPLSFEPGEKYQYSNSGYVVLGKIVEKVSGIDYYDYVREYIYKSAGMNNTDHYERDIPVPNLATGYTRMGLSGDFEMGPRRENSFIIGVKGSPAGGGYSTVDDLMKFYIALSKHRLLSPEYTNFVLPLRKTTNESKPRIIGLAGGAPGIAALLEIYLDLSYITIILSNYDIPNMRVVHEKIKEMILQNS